ncbi:MAG: thiolase family protein [Thermoleophilia bacterium]|nr:thiolase family protein [Thermoleophilia bacterium]
MSSDAFVIQAIRTPVGRRGGMLSGWHPVDLLAETLVGLVNRAGVDPSVIDDVIVGCVDQVGEQSVNMARSAVLAAGFPETVPATTVDRQCGSAQQAAHFAAQGVMAGAYEVVIAAGVESMTRVPMWSNALEATAPYGTRFRDRYDLGPDEFISQGLAGEIVAARWELDRASLDAFALESHRKAASATKTGLFAQEMLPIPVEQNGDQVDMVADEGIRPNTTREALAELKPVFKEDGVLTAGNSSQISDGAAALLIVSESAAARLNLTPKVRFHSFALAGVNPVEMLTGPIPATRSVLERSGLALEDIDLFEINEAFASVPLAWARELDADTSKLNVNGGAIAIGHPIGSTGARLMTSLIHEMGRREARYGLQAMCEGGGIANATILERL